MSEELHVDLSGTVAHIHIRKPPHNFFDAALIRAIVDALGEADKSTSVRVSLLFSEGKNFCAGLDFRRSDNGNGEELYAQAARLFGREKPLIAAIQGAAVGGGLGLALAADFRVASEQARFQANFVALSLYPGFAITQTLPALVGQQKARDILLTGRRVGAAEALSMGLVDRLSSPAGLMDDARSLAFEISGNAPLGISAVRSTLLYPNEKVAAAAMAEELAIQHKLIETDDFKESMKASAEGRAPIFTGR